MVIASIRSLNRKEEEENQPLNYETYGKENNQRWPLVREHVMWDFERFGEDGRNQMALRAGPKSSWWHGWRRLVQLCMSGGPWGQLCSSAPAPGLHCWTPVWQWALIRERMGLSYSASSTQGIPLVKQKYDMAQSKSPHSVLICWNSSIWQLQRRKEQKKATVD